MSGRSDAPLTLSVITPKGKQADLLCDSVQVTAGDNTAEKGGGSCGIRKGHEKALIALGAGPLTASLKGQRILSATAGKGFATVCRDVITVVVDTYTQE